MFIMPTPEDLAKMSADEVEACRIEAEKECNLISQQMTEVQLARNSIKRQDLDLADKIAKARVNLKDVKLCADRLKSLFFQKRSGY